MKWLKAPARKPQKPSALPQSNEFKRSRKRKPRKPLWRRALEEVWDEVEDIFD
ncbi:hypothetical protein [Litoreibacter ascidiaceicola]|nr:hypothetical protein [Litoreibacter ascidiaceicola]